MTVHAPPSTEGKSVRLISDHVMTKNSKDVISMTVYVILRGVHRTVFIVVAFLRRIGTDVSFN